MNIRPDIHTKFNNILFRESSATPGERCAMMLALQHMEAGWPLMRATDEACERFSCENSVQLRRTVQCLAHREGYTAKEEHKKQIPDCGSGTWHDLSWLREGCMVQIAHGDWFEVWSHKPQVGEPNTLAIKLGKGGMTWICRDLITAAKGNGHCYSRDGMCESSR